MTNTVNTTMDCSIVIPVYYNEGSLESTMASIKNDVLVQNPGLNIEIIFVDDGSGDGSLNEMIKIQKNNPKIVTVIKLTRNFGQVNAVLAGFTHARGKCVVTMAADGQDPFVLINKMLKAHLDEGVEIVICERRGRDDSWYRGFTSKIFYTLMRKLNFPNMPPGGFDIMLLGRRALEVLLRNKEAYPFFQGQVLYMGFKTKVLGYRRLKREMGKSRWNFYRKLKYLIDGVMSYSFLPIRLMSAIGISISLLGFVYAMVIFVLRLMGYIQIKGWTPMIIVILVLGGLQMFMLGIIGEYIWRTLAQVRNRDPYIIETIYDASS